MLIAHCLRCLGHDDISMWTPYGVRQTSPRDKFCHAGQGGLLAPKFPVANHPPHGCRSFTCFPHLCGIQSPTTLGTLHTPQWIRQSFTVGVKRDFSMASTPTIALNSTLPECETGIRNRLGSWCILGLIGPFHGRPGSVSNTRMGGSRPTEGEFRGKNLFISPGACYS